MGTQAIERNVLTSAHDGVGLDQMLQFITQRKRAVQQPRKLPLFCTNRKQFARFLMVSSNRVPRDLAFDNRQIKPTNAG
jgi:hypothetical protein